MILYKSPTIPISVSGLSLSNLNDCVFYLPAMLGGGVLMEDCQL